MKKVILVTALFFSCSSFATITSYVCTVTENPSNTALVAGKSFVMSVDGNFGINANFTYPVQIESSYLGRCSGSGSENNHPLAEGFAGTATLGGSQCAADGFDIFVSAGITNENKHGLIQVDAGSESVFYSCTQINN